MNSNRRTFLKVLGGAGVAGLAAAPLFRAMAGPGAAAASDGELFIFVHASGGWDVTLWADPRNEKKGLVDPASTVNTDTGSLKRWVDKPIDDELTSFQIVQPPGCNIPFGPGIGDLVELHDRLCVVNGLAMNTVSHPDGTVYSATGRHTNGGRVVASSIDTMMANELGRESTFPCVSLNFPSYFVGDGLDRRVVPLRIGGVDAITKTLTRSQLYDTDADRDAVTALLSKEASDLAAKSNFGDVLQGMSLQYDALRKMLGSKLQDAFSTKSLKDAYPDLMAKKGKGGGGKKGQLGGVSAAFAVEAMRRNVVRCVSFAIGGFDTHNTNYQKQAGTQEDLFDLIATLVKTLDVTPHPTKTGKKLSDHTHILVMSDFCRTPQINIAGGRDHYPNNSALVISPRFRRNFVFGKSDPEQLLPAQAGTFSDGPRAIAPPDLLATFVSAFGVNPSKYLRDGEVVKELLST